MSRTIRLPNELWAAMTAEAMSEDMSVPTWIRRLLRATLKQRLEVMRMVREAQEGKRP
jgi:predicted HicB family RNase H-like nuclease